jgi:iron complex transport system permease protein
MKNLTNKDRGFKTKLNNIPLYYSILLILIIFLVFSILASITFGNADISIREVYSVIAFELLHFDSLSKFAEGPIHDVVWLLRFPRVLLAICIGMGLSVCGVVMQAVVKNSLADPYILGVSSGASLGATTAIMLGFGALFGSNSIGIMAFLGALAATFAVMTLSNMGGRSNSSKLVLSGMAIGAVCTAFSNCVLYVTNNKTAAVEVAYWTMGSLAGADWSKVLLLLPLFILGTLFFCTQFRNLNLMLMGDEVSITLGTDLYKYRLVYMIISSIIIGFAVYAAGMIGFVGLIIPHIIRMIFGTDHKKVIPLSAVTGSIFMIWADVLCRVLIPNSEIPIGILVSMIGAPCFIYLMVKKSYGFGGGE